MACREMLLKFVCTEKLYNDSVGSIRDSQVPNRKSVKTDYFVWVLRIAEERRVYPAQQYRRLICSSEFT